MALGVGLPPGARVWYTGDVAQGAPGKGNHELYLPALPRQGLFEMQRPVNATDIKWTEAMRASGVCNKHDKQLSVTIVVPRAGHVHFVEFRCESTVEGGCQPANWNMLFCPSATE